MGDVATPRCPCSTSLLAPVKGAKCFMAMSVESLKAGDPLAPMCPHAIHPQTPHCQVQSTEVREMESIDVRDIALSGCFAGLLHVDR